MTEIVTFWEFLTKNLRMFTFGRKKVSLNIYPSEVDVSYGGDHLTLKRTNIGTSVESLMNV